MTAKGLETKGRKQSERIRRMVVAAMLSAITAVLVFTPIGMIPLPPPLPAVTMVHIPVMLAVLTEGLAVGLTVGLVFGLCSLIRAWESGMVGLTLFFRNPLVSVLPRLLVPLVALGMYWLWKKSVEQSRITKKTGAAVAAVLGSLTNTIGCLGMILILYGKELTDLLQGMIATGNVEAGASQNAAAWLLAAVGLPNGIAEAVVAAVLVPILKTAVEAVMRRVGRKSGPNRPKEQKA